MLVVDEVLDDEVVDDIELVELELVGVVVVVDPGVQQGAGFCTQDPPPTEASQSVCNKKVPV